MFAEMTNVRRGIASLADKRSGYLSHLKTVAAEMLRFNERIQNFPKLMKHVEKLLTRLDNEQASAESILTSLEDLRCPICMGEGSIHDEGKWALCVPCGHGVFHVDCLKTHLETVNTECPYCRRKEIQLTKIFLI
jgi:hypothetical protein